MKKYAALILLISVAGCKSTTFKNQTVNLISGCPKDGSCTTKIFPNKAIAIKTDESDQNSHYELVDDADKSTIVFEYSRNVPKDIMDAGMREEIVIQVGNSVKEGKVANPTAVFGRFCYCKGYTGYYKIKTSILTTDEKGGQRDFNFQFTIDEVPQIVKSIDFSIK